MYGDANGYTPVAQMASTNSWFVCYRRGTVHGGGNDVWYYSQGDISVPGMGFRQAWGYMPAVSVHTHIDPWPGVPQCPDGYSPPAKTDGRSTVIMVHGYDTNAVMNCRNWFANAKSAYAAIGYSTSQLVTVKYYASDQECNADIGVNASDNTSIATIGNSLAWYIYNNYSRFGKNVDVIAHSMGALVIRTAITGTQNRFTAPFNAYSWPPYLYVQDVSTLGGPYEGGFPNSSIGCAFSYNDLQCREMVEGNYFIQNWIKPYGNPQAWYYNGRGGTDWTMIGSFDDYVALASSAMELHSPATFGHKVAYTSGTSSITHDGMMFASTTGTYRLLYCDYYNPCDQNPPFCVSCQFAYNFSSWYWSYPAEAPVEVAAWGSYYAGGR